MDIKEERVVKIKILLEVLFFVIFFVLIFIETYLLKLKLTVWLAAIDGAITTGIHLIIKNKVLKGTYR